MTMETYKRGQVEWAIWQFMASEASKTDTPPKTFQTRIKRLLELDRTEVEGRPGLAFTEMAPAGQGTDRTFTAFDAFCLSLALTLIDMGFKQAEVVFLMQHSREELSRPYQRAMRWPKPSRQRIHPRDHPEWPTYEIEGSRWVDLRLFMLIAKVEMTELFPQLKDRTKSDDPIILRPAFLEGVDQLTAYFNKRQAFRRSMVLEIGHTARKVTTWLTLAAEIKRGR